MPKALRTFQVFAKPTGSVCNLGCRYCYYLEKGHLYGKGDAFPMPDDLLEEYIVQHIKASSDPVIRFSWHGGEPTVLGLRYFQKIVAIQRKHRPPKKRIANGIQTNGTLLDEDWCRFLARKGFAVGLSMDGPQDMHDAYRVTKDGRPTHHLAMRGYNLLRAHGISPDILCVVHDQNVEFPIQVYRFFKQLKARYIGFLPLVETEPYAEWGVSRRTVPAEAFGDFLCTIFDEWRDQDIGEIRVQIFEEAAKSALNQEHELCIFRETCGDVPVVEHNGDLFSCDHFVDPAHRLGNIREMPFEKMLESPLQRAFGQNKREALPRYCQDCEVLDLCHGECPKNRFIRTPNGEEGLNYLCAAYRRFFHYCRPFIMELSALYRRQTMAQPLSQGGTAGTPARKKIGRNDPCPCGSGRKYKKCCMGK